MADLDGISYLRTLRPNTPVLYGPDEEFPIGGCARCCATATTVTIVGCGITVHEALKAADQLGRRARVIDCYSIKPIDGGDARGRGARDRAPRRRRGSLARGRPRRGGARGARRARASSAKVTQLAVRDMPRSGKPDELLAAFGIDADAIVEAPRTRATSLYGGMAVVIGTNLRKELAGGLLFDGVSFKVERRERLALSGPNGAGKTTLLRMLAGETGVDGGQLVFDKGTRVALHDQRPPLDLGLIAARVRALGRARPDRARGGAAPARDGDGRRRPRAGDDARATPRRRRGSSTRAATPGARTRSRRCAGSASTTSELDRQLDTFSGGELTRASLARALAGDPDLLLLDEPTNHLDVERLEWLERTLVGLDAAVILVAHDRWFLEAMTTAVLELEAGRSTYFPGRVARLAAREGGARCSTRRSRSSATTPTSRGSSASSTGSGTRSRRRSRRRRSSRTSGG